MHKFDNINTNRKGSLHVALYILVLIFLIGISTYNMRHIIGESVDEFRGNLALRGGNIGDVM